MKKIFSAIILSVLLVVSINSYAGYVKGYYKSNGTYVNGYHRSDRNNTVKDNYSYYGNLILILGKLEQINITIALHQIITKVIKSDTNGKISIFFIIFSFSKFSRY